MSVNEIKYRKSLFIHLILIIIVMVIVFAPLWLVKNAEFAGADGQAEEMISEIVPDYQPWFLPIWEPQSTEIESFLFALQASMGAGILGYGIGTLKCRRENQSDRA